jgi:hypothetical protein
LLGAGLWRHTGGSSSADLRRCNRTG